MPDYTIFNDSSDIPNTRKKITVVTRYDSDNLLVQDYQYGRPADDGELFGPTDIDDSILNYRYRDEVLVEQNAAGNFDCLVHFADVFRKCDGDIDAICDVLDNEEFEIL